VLISWTLGASYFPGEVPGIAPAAAYLLGLASVLLLFASILLHELGHALVARRQGVRVAGIDLWLLGGVARLEGEAHAPGQELRFALAGPAVTAVVLASFAVLRTLLPGSTPAALRALVDYQVLINALILGFNLMPAFPLDGGRVARALLWMRLGERGRATRMAAAAGGSGSSSRTPRSTTTSPRRRTSASTPSSTACRGRRSGGAWTRCSRWWSWRTAAGVSCAPSRAG
jgi:Zn-dependent protease